MQKAISETVKKARVAELKSMLSQVPVPAAGVEFSLGISVAKIAATVAGAAAIVAGSVYYLNQADHKSQVKTVKDSILDKIEIPTSSLPVISPKEDSVENASEKGTEELKQSSNSQGNKPQAKSKTSTKSAPVSKPKIDAFDASKELTNEPKSKETVENHSAQVVASRIPVETNDANRKYTFHYQFANGTLILYGAFDKGLYEVLEVTGNAHSLFLYYKDGFYLLNEKQKQVLPLQPITDPLLISKLKEYRSR
jgi:hypothetical protein